jgi:tRNA nucleotidyltransferase (CCA-adding enzyme)
LPSALLDALERERGGRELLAAASAAAGSGPVHLVGGSVRDLLRGVRPRELDVVVEGPIEPLLDALGGALVLHDRFGTASASVDGARVDVTMSRRERYPRPGALPEVEPAPLADDLLRRDFAVNAIALSLPAGELRAAPHAEEDLAAGLLRVLHEGSFIDDPTRLWRLGRYAARLGFRAEERTAELARVALARDALKTVSGTRIGAELRLALTEDDAPAALRELGALGALTPAGLGVGLDEPLMREAMEMLPDDGRPDLLLLSTLIAPATSAGSGPAIAALLDEFEFPAADRDRTVASVLALPRLQDGLAASSHASALYALAASAPIEAVALAGALAGRRDAAARAAAVRWLSELRHVRLQISGDDLVAAGIPEGPEIGRRLRAALDLRLDGKIGTGKEAELEAALGAS